MKICIFGSKGLLGGALMSQYNDQAQGFDLPQIDVTDAEAVMKCILAGCPDVVINATAYTNVDGAEEPEGRVIAEKVNGRAPGYLARAAKAVNATFVHYSTEMVFSGSKKSYKEDDAPKPQNAYGETKAMGEQAVKDVGGKFYIIRLSRLYGPLPEGHPGKEPFINLMLRLAKEKPELTGVDDETSCQTYNRDLAEFTKALIEEKADYGIYHGVNTGAASWFEFAKEAFKINHIKIPFNPVSGKTFPRPAHRAPYVELLNTKRPQMRPWQNALQAYFTEFPID